MKDKEYKKLIQQVQELRTKRNSAAKEINELKKAGKDIKAKIKEVKQLPEKIKKIEEKANTLKKQLKFYLLSFPNIFGNLDQTFHRKVFMPRLACDS